MFNKKSSSAQYIFPYVLIGVETIAGRKHKGVKSREDNQVLTSAVRRLFF